MRPHKYNIGAFVDFQAKYSQSAGAFVVVRQLPPDSEGNQYRIENRKDGGLRVAHEGELSRPAHAMGF